MPAAIAILSIAVIVLAALWIHAANNRDAYWSNWQDCDNERASAVRAKIRAESDLEKTMERLKRIKEAMK